MGNADTNFDIYIRTLLDKGSTQQVETGVKNLNKNLDDVEKHVHEINKAGNDEGLVKAMDDAAKVAKEKLNPALAETVKTQKQIREEAKQAAQEAQLQARVWQTQARQMMIQITQTRAQAAGLIRASSAIGTVSRGALVAGGAIVGGAFAESNQYAKDVEGTSKATEATKAWTAATKELAQARGRVDAVVLKETLPLLQQAAHIATQAAAFVEKNPQIISAALKTGEVVAGLGAVGLLVSKGIKLYADVQYIATVPVQLQAAQLQAQAAEQQLVAAQLQAEAKSVAVAEAPVTAATGAGLGGKIGTVALYAGSVVLGANIGLGIGNFINKLIDPKAAEVTWKDIGTEAKQILAISAYEIGKGWTISVDKAVREKGGLEAFQKAAEALGLLSNNADKASDSLSKIVSNALSVRGSEHEGEIVSAFEKWKEDDAKLVQDAADKRLEIISKSEQAIAAETQKYANTVANINEQTDKHEATLLANFQKENIKSEQKYQADRAKLLKNEKKEILDIEKQHQERLRKLTQDHNDRVEELSAARDALGLAKENRQFERAKAEEDRSTNDEIAKRRQDLADRLNELAQEHQAEMTQRAAEFHDAMVQAEADRADKLKEAEKAHEAELTQLRQQRAAQLSELQQTLDAERQRRRNEFIATIRDLDASLLGERNLKIMRYNQMLTDVDQWLAKYRASLQSLSTITAPVHDYSGYAYSGLYQMAANGQPEYVMSGAMTKAAESIIGSGLTEQSLMSALMRSRNSNNVSWDYRPRFEGEYTQAMRMAVRRDAKQVVHELVRSLEQP